MDRLSKLRIYMDKDMRPQDARNKAAAAVSEVLKRFPDGVPLLDPEADMKIDNASFRKLERRIETLEGMLAGHKAFKGGNLPERLSALRRKRGAAERAKLAGKKVKEAQTLILKVRCASVEVEPSRTAPVCLPRSTPAVLLESAAAGQMPSRLTIRVVFAGRPQGAQARAHAAGLRLRGRRGAAQGPPRCRDHHVRRARGHGDDGERPLCGSPTGGNRRARLVPHLAGARRGQQNQGAEGEGSGQVLVFGVLSTVQLAMAAERGSGGGCYSALFGSCFSRARISSLLLCFGCSSETSSRLPTEGCGR